MARVLFLLGLLCLAQGDVPQLLGVVQDIKASLPLSEWSALGT